MGTQSGVPDMSDFPLFRVQQSSAPSSNQRGYIKDQVKEVLCPVCNNPHSLHGTDENFFCTECGTTEDLGCEATDIPNITTDSVNDIQIGSLGYITIPASQWSNGSSPEVIVTEIEWKRSPIQWVFLRIGGSEIRLEINTKEKLVTGYTRKQNTKNRSGKGYKWVRVTPAEIIRSFLEKNLSVKFALS